MSVGFTGLIVAMGLLAACSSPPKTLAPGESPDLVLVIADGVSSGASGASLSPGLTALAASGVSFGGAWSADAAAQKDHALALTSTWPVGLDRAPNSLPGVLSLYGYRVEAAVGPGFLAAADGGLLDNFDVTRETDCGAALTLPASEPWFLLVHQPAGCPADDALTAVQEALAAAGLTERALVVFTGSASADTLTPDSRVPLVIRDPRAAPSHAGTAYDQMGTTMDLMPTLLLAAGAVVPSDAWGASRLGALRGEFPSRVAVFQRGPGVMGIRTGAHLLVMPEPDSAAGLPKRCEGGVLTPLADEAAPPGAGKRDTSALCDALLAWRRGLESDSARERMGSEAFGRMLREGGYW